MDGCSDNGLYLGTFDTPDEAAQAAKDFNRISFQWHTTEPHEAQACQVKTKTGTGVRSYPASSGGTQFATFTIKEDAVLNPAPEVSSEEAWEKILPSFEHVTYTSKI